MSKMRIFILISGIIVALILGLAGYVYATEDAIGKAHWDTTLVLQKYTWSLANEEQVIDWIAKYHGEDRGHQVMISFVSFGLSHPGLFLKVLSHLPADAKNETIDRITFAVTDAGLEQKFTSSFGFKIQELKAKLGQ